VRKTPTTNSFTPELKIAFGKTQRPSLVPVQFLYPKHSPVLKTRDSGIILDDIKGVKPFSFWGFNVCHFDE
jgi:hypothetical protein